MAKTSERKERYEYLLENPSKATFEEFFTIYAAKKGWPSIPEFHYELIEFLADDENWKDDLAVVQCFRNAAKSSIVAPWVVWRLACNPDQHVMIQSADDRLAKKMVRDCKSIIKSHPLATHLFSPDLTWAAKEFDVIGNTDGRSFSVASYSIGATPTGSRAHLIIYDDVEVPKNSKTASLREKLRDDMGESQNTLHPEGKRLYIGTPHTHDSIYPEMVEQGASCFIQPFINSPVGEFPNITGDSAWPDRWPMEKILAKQRSPGMRKRDFMSQFQLEAMSSEEQRFDSQMLKFYNEELEFISANKSTEFRFKSKRVVSVCAWWDPSMNTVSGDDSVLSIMFNTDDGQYYLHRTYKLLGDPWAQADQLKKYLVEHHIGRVCLEKNGVGATFPAILLSKVRGLIAVMPVHTTQNKQEAILQAFDTPLAAGLINVHNSVRSGKFISQLRDFNPNHPKDKDDFIDSAAKALLQLPVVIGRGVTNTIKGHESFRRFQSGQELQRVHMFKGSPGSP